VGHTRLNAKRVEETPAAFAHCRYSAIAPFTVLTVASLRVRRSRRFRNRVATTHVA
jgi:hypothetical protein